MSAKLKIPVIILNWNGIEDTRMCIEALSKQTCQEFYIYLIDNGSDDKNVIELKKIARADPSINLILHDENLGFVGAHNLAFQDIFTSTKANGVILLNNDAFPQPDYIDKMSAHLHRYDSDIIVTKMLSYYNPKVYDNMGHILLNTAEIIPNLFGRPLNTKINTNKIAGACAGSCYYSRAMLVKMNYFDTYFSTGYEDAELSLRALLSGYKMTINEEAVVFHKGSASINKVKDLKYVIRTQINIFYTYFKLMPTSVLLINIPFLVLKYLLVLLVNLLTGRLFFFKVVFNAIWSCLTSERKKILRARRNFYSTQRVTLSVMEILQKMTFFLGFDLQRFYHLILKKRPSYFEPNRDTRPN